jgi:hypothetical protein
MVKNKKGIIKMTTNEQITSIPAEAFNNQQRADEIVKTMTSLQIVDEVTRLLDEVDNYKAKWARQDNRANENQAKYINTRNAVEEFIKDKIKEDAVDIDDLKELAEELNISLTKSIKITFTVKAEYEFNVPLDWTDDDISDGDFDIRISHNLNDDDIEETSEGIEVEDFEVEDND